MATTLAIGRVAASGDSRKCRPVLDLGTYFPASGTRLHGPAGQRGSGGGSGGVGHRRLPDVRSGAPAGAEASGAGWYGQDIHDRRYATAPDRWQNMFPGRNALLGRPLKRLKWIRFSNWQPRRQWQLLRCRAAATFSRHAPRPRHLSAVSSSPIPLADTVRLWNVSFKCEAEGVELLQQPSGYQIFKRSIPTRLDC